MQNIETAVVERRRLEVAVAVAVGDRDRTVNLVNNYQTGGVVVQNRSRTRIAAVLTVMRTLRRTLVSSVAERGPEIKSRASGVGSRERE